MAGSRSVSEHPCTEGITRRAGSPSLAHNWRTLLCLQALRVESRLAEPALPADAWSDGSLSALGQRIWESATGVVADNLRSALERP
jgi:hypothetical protein